MLQPASPSLDGSPRNPLLTAGGLLLLAAGAGADMWMLAAHGGQVGWRLPVLVLAPGLILLFTEWLVRNTPSMSGCLTVVALVLAAVSGFWAFMGVAMVVKSEPVTAPERYGEIMEASRRGEREYLAHFPEQIPEDAEDVRFYHLPGFLQGVAVWELRMTLPPERVKTIVSDLPEEMEELKPEQGPRLHAGPSARELPQFPVLRATVKGGGDRHGPVHGIAADPESGEIMFWAEYR